ncbi:hypothetical protein Tco_1188846 [Tanacetum coccineum]
MIWRILPNKGGKILKLIKITLIQIDAEIQERHKHEQEEITTAGAEVSNVSPEVKLASDSIDDIAAET